MGVRADDIDLNRLELSAGEGRRLDVLVEPGDFALGGERYTMNPARPEARLDVSRTSGNGYSLRLRFAAGLAGRCMRCLEPAEPGIEIDAREVDQPGAGEELSSPYLDESGVLDVAAWARDAVVLALPAQVRCRADCAGLCGVCGENLNVHPHEHERPPDPRWAKLRELGLD